MKVFIVGSYQNDYHRMFTTRGWKIVSELKDSDLVQFTGGEDVGPKLYGHARHRLTRSNPVRDYMEQIVFHRARHENIPMAGICRGAQFLNVMCGGKMWQHSEGHTTGRHMVRDLIENFEFEATSTHHQIMMPHDEGLIVAVSNEATVKEKASDAGVASFITRYGKEDDPEVVYYMDQACLCFQPHPEFPTQKELQDIYFYYLEAYLELGVKY